MKVIAVDLELNQPSSKIIQIGAVCFDPVTGEVADIFNKYVNPFELINPEITKLTGITNEMTKDQKEILNVAAEFVCFKNNLKASPIGITWGGTGSETNDISHIFKEANIENPFKKRFTDVKTIYQMLANVSNQKFKSKVGLGTACQKLGLNWDLKYGNQHDALADAYNTMRVYMFLSKCLKAAVEIKLG